MVRIFNLLTKNQFVMRQFLQIAACAAALAGLFACNKLNEPQAVNAPEDADATTTTKAAVANSPILAVYVETNDVNPLNAMDYQLNGEPLIDIVELFAANIHKETVNGQVRPTLYLNDKLANILENGGVEEYVWPLQDVYIKVLLTILGDHQGIGLANMNATQAEQFATILAATVYHYGLDGIGFDDEYADYPYGSVNNTSYSNILLSLREQLDEMGDGYLMTVFDWGYTNTISNAAAACIDYGYHGYFGSYVTSRSFPIANSGWSPVSFNLGQYNDPDRAEEYAARAKNDGYGAMMCFNLRTRTNVTASTGETISGNDPLPVFQGLADGAYNGGTVTVPIGAGNRSRDVEIDPDGFTITYDMALEWLAE